MLRLVLLLALFCAFSCSKEPPPTAPAGKATDDDCDLCDLFDFLEDQSDGDTASDSASDSSSSESSLSDVVFIPDTALRALIEKKLKKSPGETITQSEMNTIESLLGGDNLGIKNLRGLEAAKNLRQLSLSDNAISDLTPLANLTQLRYLPLRDNAISDLTPLANLTQLQYLGLDRNQKISDLTPLANLTQLNYLSLDDNRISDLTPLADLTRLRELDVSGNQVSDLSPLIGLASPPLGIRVLKTWNNPLSEASIHEHIPTLQSRGVDVSFSSSTDTESPFSIDLVFLGDSTVEEQEILRHAAKRWEAAIQTELPNYTFPDAWFGACGEHSIEIPAGEQIDDLRIYVTRFPGKDAWRRPAGSGAPRLLRSSSLPIIGCVQYNTQFIVSDTQVHPLWGVGFHEMGHVLGIGTIWDDSGMLRDLNADAHFAGPQAIAAFDQAGGTDYQGAKVPTEQDGAHWRSSVLSGEIMRPSFSSVDALSAITLQALSDLGYSVDLSEADPYVLPPPSAAKPVADAVPFCSLEGLPAPVYVQD